MIAQELEVSLHMAFVEARQKQHEFITVEHLLLALLDNPTAAEVLRCLGSLRTWVTTPFQDIYGAMVARASALDSPRLVHIVMRLDGTVVGYHSFAESDKALHALSGAFDRERHSNFHAYENMIIETARYCAEHGKTIVEFGPVLNETKKAMMSGFVRSHARTYSRFAPYRWTVPFVVERSHLSSARIAPYVGLKAGTLDDQDASDA